MELDNIGALAVRALATDLANLTARLAVMTAVMEDLLQRVNTIDQSQWKPVPLREEGVEEGEPVDYEVHLPSAEMSKVQQIIQVIRSMD